MNSIKLLALAVLTALITLTSCEKDDDDQDLTKDINLNITGLSALGDDYVYEGWIIVDGTPISSGIFTVDNAGNLSETTFSLNMDDVDAASKFVLTIEPKNDPDAGPSETKYLAGDFSGNTANVAIGPVGDFSTSAGDYILATPTNGASNDENSGIWWLNPSSGTPVNGLSLPTLPAGWKYEGWVVIEGQPVSTGTFTNVSATDDADTYSGPMPLPSPNGNDGFFPGEDFIINAPTDLSFPTDIAGGTAVISVEPFPDNDLKPFKLKPLVGMIPADATDHKVYSMDQNLDFPTGTITR